MSLHSGLVLSLPVVFACGSAVAADQGEPESVLDQVVVSATALPTEYEKIGSSLTVVDGEQIEDGGYAYVPDVLRQVPGLAVNRTGPYGGLTQVRTRGAEGNHTIVLFNGVDVSDAGQGETDLSTLLAVNIDRIEVLRGPQSGLYGSNALAGVINILTPKEADGGYYNGSAEFGSFGTRTLLAGGGVGNGSYYVDGGIGYLDSDGFDSSPLGAVNGPPGVGGDKEGYRNATVYLSSGVKVSPSLRFDGFARYVDSKAQLDGFDFSFIPGQQGLTYDDASETSTKSYNLAGSGTLSLLDDRWVTSAFLHYTHNHAEAEDGIAGDEYGDKARRTKYGIRSSIKSGADGLVNTLTGFVEGKRERYRNTHPSAFASAEFTDPQSRKLVGLGVQDQLEIAGQLYLSGAYRHDDNDKFDNADTYSLAASWVLKDSGTRPHASFGKGVTNPGFTEQFGYDPGTYVGNPDLKPESAKGWDLGIEQAFAAGRALVDVTWFSSKLHDEIYYYTDPETFVGTYSNEAGVSTRKGLELYTRISPVAGVDIVGSYTWLKAREGDPKTVEVRRPKNQAALDASWRLLADKLRFTAGVTYNGVQYDNDYTQYGLPPDYNYAALKSKVPSYTLVRLAAGYQFAPGFEVVARVENLFDKDYEEVIGYRAPGRTAYVGFRLSGAAR